jgi:hypothetical protein
MNNDDNLCLSNDDNRTALNDETIGNPSTDSIASKVDPLLTTTNRYKDFAGIDTESFITTTLRDQPKDRALLLSLETFFQEFINDEQQTAHQFQAMNSCTTNMFTKRTIQLFFVYFQFV